MAPESMANECSSADAFVLVMMDRGVLHKAERGGLGKRLGARGGWPPSGLASKAGRLLKLD